MGELTGAIYGGALYGAAAEENAADEIYEQVLVMQELLKSFPDFMRLIRSAALSKQEKKDALRAVLEGRVNRLMVNTMMTVIDKKREKYLPDILDSYERSYFAGIGIAKGQLITAVPAGKKQIKHLEKILSRKTGKQIIIENIVDESIIGGAKLKLEGMLTDGSLRGRIDALKCELNGNMVKAGDGQ